MFQNGFCILRLHNAITTRSSGPIAVRIMIWATVHMVATGHGIWDNIGIILYIATCCKLHSSTV